MKVVRRGALVLAYEEFGKGSTAALFLHGLAGWSGEWAPTVKRLSSTHRMVVLDQRGHGRSTLHPGDVSRAAYVSDVVALIEALDAGPVALTGQSLGGHTAMLVAAERPDLVNKLIIIEATPERDAGAPKRIRHWLSSWPVPFPSRGAAIDFFSTQDYFHSTLAARVWAGGLEERPGGLWPRFDIEVMADSLREVAAYDYWDRWEAICCPTLIVRGEHGTVSAEQAIRMLEHLHAVNLIEVAGAGHDVHLDQPDQWCSSAASFLQGHGADHNRL